jgi:hypothetical protein
MQDKKSAFAKMMDGIKLKTWKKYSREMAASIITYWSLKMIYKMRDKREAKE